MPGPEYRFDDFDDPYDPYRQRQQPYGHDPYRQHAYGSEHYPQASSGHHPYPYDQSGYPAPYEPRKTNQYAIMALICAFMLGPVGIYLGMKAKKEIAASGEDGEGLATGGVIVGWINTGLLALSCALVIFYVLIVGSLVASI